MICVLDDQAQRAIKLGLDRLARQYRTDGLPTPDVVTELIDTFAATDGHVRPDDRPDEEPLHNPVMAPLLLDYDSAGQRLGISERTVRRLVADGELPAVSIGSAKRIHVDDLDEYTQRLRAA